MRNRFHNAMMALAALGLLTASGWGQGATTTPGGVTGTTAPTVARNSTGFAVQDGVVYFLRNGRVTSVNEEILPKGQIMTPTGLMAPDVPGLDGFTLEKGAVYYTRHNLRERVDVPGRIPAGQIMNLWGELITMPPGVTGFPGTQAITIPRTVVPPATSSEIYR